MRIQNIIKKVQEKIAEKKAAPLNPQPFEPVHYLWFQSKDDLQAFVSKVNNKYNYQIYKVHPHPNSKSLYKMRPSGKKIEEGYAETLSLAKKKVFKYFEKIK